MNKNPMGSMPVVLDPTPTLSRQYYKATKPNLKNDTGKKSGITICYPTWNTSKQRKESQRLDGAC